MEAYDEAGAEKNHQKASQVGIFPGKCTGLISLKGEMGLYHRPARGSGTGQVRGVP